MGKSLRTALLGTSTLAAGVVAFVSCSSLSGLSNGPGPSDAQPDALATDASAPDVTDATDVSSPDSAMQSDAVPDSNPGCSSSPCVLATNLNHPVAVTSDERNVYWAEYGTDLGTQDGFVKGCPVSGCGSAPLVYGAALINPRGLVTDGSNIYYGTASYAAVNGAIWSCPLAGCNGHPTMLTSAQSPYGMAVDSTYLYWVDYNDNSIHRTAKAGGADLALYDGGGPTLVSPMGCAVDNAFVYITDFNNDVAQVPVGGGPLAIMALGNIGGPCPLAIDQSDVYWGTTAGSVIIKASKTTNDGGVPLAINVYTPEGLAMDPAGGTLYWANWGSGLVNDGTVGKVNVDGSNEINLVTSLVTPLAVTVNSAYVFWVSSGALVSGSANTAPNTGALMRGSK